MKTEDNKIPGNSPAFSGMDVKVKKDQSNVDSEIVLTFTSTRVAKNSPEVVSNE